MSFLSLLPVLLSLLLLLLFFSLCMYALLTLLLLCYRFWMNGAWDYVVIDDLLPSRYVEEKKSYRQVYSASFCVNEFWVSLLEKAYAKIYGVIWGWLLLLCLVLYCLYSIIILLLLSSLLLLFAIFLITNFVVSQWYSNIGLGGQARYAMTDFTGNNYV